jgi:hypothetical protein
MDAFRNPDVERIAGLLYSLDRTLGAKLEDFWNDEIKDAVGSIVGNRHLIAHGRDTTLTFSRVSEWHGYTQKLIGFLEKELQ